jgi:hypothetical protein
VGEHPPPTDPTEPDDLDRLLDRARRGDSGALPELRAALDGRPELWRRAGDLVAHVERAWIGLVAGPDAFLAEALDRRLHDLKAELSGGRVPSPLERLLVDRVAATWLQVAHADASAAKGDVTVRQAAFALKRQGEAHRRHLTAIGALATLRRLLPGDDRPPRDDGPPKLDGPEGSPATGPLAAAAVPLAVFDPPGPGVAGGPPEDGS